METGMLANLKMIFHMALEFYMIQMGNFIKDNGKTVSKKEKEYFHIMMEVDMRESFSMMSQMDMVSIGGRMEGNMKGSGKTAKSMERGFYIFKIVNGIKVTGITTLLMERGSCIKLMVKNKSLPMRME